MNRNSDKPFRIVLEGLPGAGKTSLCNDLSKALNCPHVKEWSAWTEQEWRAYQWNEPFYLANDSMKEMLAQNCRSSWVVIDRHYASTLAYAFALSVAFPDKELLPRHLADEKYSDVLSWYERKMEQGSLRKPDLVLLLDISTEVSHKRKPPENHKDPVWREPQALEAMRRYYRDFYSEIETSTQLKVVNSVIPQNEVLSIALDLISNASSNGNRGL